jgi:hypothetical protein
MSHPPGAGKLMGAAGVQRVDSLPIGQSCYFQRLVENFSISTVIMLEEDRRWHHVISV